MSLFFNGKLWETPSTMSAVDDSAMLSTNLGVGNAAAYLGTSTGGKPNSILFFSTAAEAEKALVSGPLLDAIKKAFAPSSETGGPSKVAAIRVNPALPASAVLKDSAGKSVINLTSTDYGQRNNQIKYKVEAGSTQGLSLTTQLGSSYYTGDNIARNAIDLKYTGSLSSASLSVTGSTVTLQAPSGTDVATIDLSTYSTYSQLVDFINTVPGWSASLSDSAFEDYATLNALDTLTIADAKTSMVTITANLQAVVDWFNGSSEGYITAERVAGAGTVPALSAFTYLSGGSEGVTTTANWSDGFATLQRADVQWITPISTNPAIWSMADAHLQYMSKYGKKERRGIVGCPAGTTKEQAKAYAKALNSDRMSLVRVGYYDYNAAGKLQLFNASYTAALLSGMFAGVNPGTALSNKVISVSGLEEVDLNPTDTDQMIPAGILCIEETNDGFKVVQSISTWLKDSKFNRVEQSCGWATDYTARSVREALDVLRGQKNNQVNLGRAKTIVEGVLKKLATAEPNGPGVLAGNAANPAYKNIVVSADGDMLMVSFTCSPVIPINYIPVSIGLQIFTGTAAA